VKWSFIKRREQAAAGGRRKGGVCALNSTTESVLQNYKLGNKLIKQPEKLYRNVYALFKLFLP
jgi:hypothetical protein